MTKQERDELGKMVEDWKHRLYWQKVHAASRTVTLDYASKEISVSTCLEELLAWLNKQVVEYDFSSGERGKHAERYKDSKPPRQR